MNAQNQEFEQKVAKRAKNVFLRFASFACFCSNSSDIGREGAAPLIPVEGPSPAAWSKRGGTLIEILLACLILAIMAVSGATAIYQTASGLTDQKNRRIALGVANSRLEDIRATPYTVLTALISQNYNTNTIKKVGNAFVAGTGETVSIGGKTMSMTNTIQYVDADGGTGTYDYLRVTVSVQYPLRSGSDVVRLQTAEGP